jgi:transposase-like protein
MTAPHPTVQAMIEGRRADTGRRRQRVLAALADATKNGTDISVAAIARRAGVDRTFLYRHRDLLAQIHAQATEPTATPGGHGPAVSRASLKADLAAADARSARLAAQVRRLEQRLSEVLGDQVWRESGIGGPYDTERLKARITTLEQQLVDLELKLQDRDDDLAAARAANRELMAQLNRGHDTPQPSPVKGQVSGLLSKRTAWRTLGYRRPPCRTNGPAAHSRTGAPSGRPSEC